ncbi:hypothetical protein E4U53_000760, partial [Claviceps sorghi]
MSADSSHLVLYSETVFESEAPSNFPLSCPSLDLSTTWDAAGRNLFIYRPPTQVVSKIHQVPASGSKAPEAVAVTWKPDGWSDGIVRLMGLENNKAAHHVAVCADHNVRITHIGWASCRIASGQAAGFSSRVRDDITHKLAASSDDSNLPPNLPLELTFLDVDTALPKVSPLPTGSAGA